MRRTCEGARGLRLVLCVALLTLALLPPGAWGTAATDTGSGFYLETLGVKIFNLCKNVIVPLLLIGIVLFMGGNVAFSWVQPGGAIAKGLLGAAIICGGIETILVLVGSNSTAAVLIL